MDLNWITVCVTINCRVGTTISYHCMRLLLRRKHPGRMRKSVEYHGLSFPAGYQDLHLTLAVVPHIAYPRSSRYWGFAEEHKGVTNDLTKSEEDAQNNSESGNVECFNWTVQRTVHWWLVLQL